jgi:hypothetical protein
MIARRREQGYLFTVKDMSGRVRDRFVVDEAAARYPVASAQWGTPVFLSRLYRLIIDRSYRRVRPSPA